MGKQRKMSSETSTERRSGTQDMINKLLAERQEMLLMFEKVAGLQPYDKNVDGDALQKFCGVLVDYSAFGHFEIYERINDGRERRKRVVDMARDVYPLIVESSEVAVEFNDKYDSADHALDLNHLDRDLGKLGEEIATRIEMEDRIIEALVAN